MNRQYLALNGLAIAIVVLNHTIMMVQDIPRELGYHPIVGWQNSIMIILNLLGIIAVPTFMFISGSFFSYAAQGKDKSLKFMYKVSWANIKHVLWPYLIWSIIFYIAVFIGRGEQYSMLGYLKNLITGYPYHFIPLLIFFYAIAPLLIRLGKRYALIILALLILYQFVIINLVYPGLFGFTLPQWMNILALPVLSSTLAVWGVFFPLGLFCGMHMRSVLPLLQRVKWILLALSITCFLIAILNAMSVVKAGWAEFLCPVLFVLLLPVIKRQTIPFVRGFEKIGQRVYGIYLTHLLVLYFLILALDLLVPELLAFRFWLLPILFALALGTPLVLMHYLQISPGRKIYPYIFG